MKVFGIGLQKTGTTTLGACLAHIGHKKVTYHRRAGWYLRRGQIQRLKDIMDKYDAFDDEPWAHCYEIADRFYPDAKFVLTVRKSPEKWYESMCKHCDRIPFNQHRKYFFGCIMPRRHKEQVLAVYNNHIEAVKHYFRDRPEKLLILCWENGDGWEKLCSFTGDTVPDTEMLWTNTAPKGKISHLTVLRVFNHIPKYYFNILKNEYILLPLRVIFNVFKKND
jgi:hypothetical protein